MSHLLCSLRRGFAPLWFALLAFPLAAATPPTLTFDVPAGEAGTTLRTFAQQAKREIVFPPVGAIRTQEVKGMFTVKAALEKLLAGTELVAFEDEKTGALTINRSSDPNGPRVARKGSDHPDQSKVEEGKVVLPTFEVMGTKLLNMDIARSRDDAQPYVTFDRDAITRSGATNIEDFLRQRLSMNATNVTNSQLNSAAGNKSSVNLRGLGVNQTLILIDGHRVAEGNGQGAPGQPDLNGIPLGAVERIEVLPTTASGIYGGNATGGVINVVLRRDYAGFEIGLTYENTFSTDTAIRRLDLTGGFTLEKGKTSVMLAASASSANGLSVQDRDFTTRGRARQLANNPASFLPPNSAPLGRTPNIRSSTGANLILDNGTVLGSAFTFVPVGYAGVAGDGGAALAANAGKYNYDLADTAQAGGGGRQALFNAPETQSLMMTVRREFGSRVQAFLELAGANNIGHFTHGASAAIYTVSAAAPNNPFQQNIIVNVPTTAADQEIFSSSYDRRAVAGLIASLPGGWKAEADYIWNRTRFTFQSIPSGLLSAAGTTAVSNGDIDVVRDTNLRPVDLAPYLTPGSSITPMHSVMRDATLRAAGPVLEAPGGTAVLSGLLERRTLSFGDGTQFINATTTSYFPTRSSAVTSAYAEMRVPVFGEGRHHAGLEELELQAALRYDDYTIHGVTSSVTNLSATSVILRSTNRLDSINPTVGLRWKLSPGVMLRASYGTGFVAPALNQIQSAASAVATTVIDPRRGNTSSVVPAGQVLSGGNPALRPEESKSWSAGIVLTPRVLPGLRLSVDWTRIKKRDNFQAFATQQIVDNEAVLAGRVVRGPSLATDLPGWAGPITSIDATLTNAARGLAEAFDLALDYHRDTTGAGSFDFYLNGTRQTHLRTQLVATAAFVENVGITGPFPLRDRANAGITWRRGNWTLGWAARYLDGYQVVNPTSATAATIILNQGSSRIPSQQYHDVFAGYRFRHAGESRFSRLLAGTDIQFGVKDVFNEAPPIDVNNGSGYYYSVQGDPRMARYYFSIKRAF